MLVQSRLEVVLAALAAALAVSGCAPEEPERPMAAFERRAAPDGEIPAVQPWQQYDGEEIGEVARIRHGCYRERLGSDWRRGSIVFVAGYEDKKKFLALSRDADGTLFSELWANFPQDYSVFRGDAIVGRLRAVRAFAYEDDAGTFHENAGLVSRRNFTVEGGTLFVECRIVAADGKLSPGDKVRLATRHIGGADTPSAVSPPPPAARERAALVPVRGEALEKATAAALTAALEARLAESGWFVLADQPTVERVLKDLDLRAEELFDRNDKLAEVGKALNVPKVLACRVDRAGKTFAATLKILDVTPPVVRLIVRRFSTGTGQDDLLKMTDLLTRDMAAALAAPRLPTSGN